MTSEMLRTAVEAARQAGALALEMLPRERDLRTKGTRDVVTDVDLAAERAIIGLIGSRFPDHAIVSEEAGASGGETNFTWIVDPLDGTRNYARRLPLFAVSIAVLEARTPIIGVVYDPVRGHMFTTVRGGGARLNDEPLRVSPVPDLAGALVNLGWGRRDQERSTALGIAGNLLPRCSSLRTLGSAALAVAYVAAGWLDAYVSLVVRSWDVAAGALAVVEAGGECTTPRGDAYRADSVGCVASNGLVHDELLAAIGEV